MLASRCAFVALLVAGALLSAAASTQAADRPSADVLRELAPAGTLRVALNVGNSALVTRDSASGTLSGVTVDLGRSLASRLGVPFVPVLYPNVGAIIVASQADEWDVAFLAIDRQRANVIDFTPAYMDVDNTYLVPSSSPIRCIGDADKSGVRIAVPARSAPDLYLSRTLQRATLVRANTEEAACQLLAVNQAEACAASRQQLLQLRDALKGTRVLDGRFLIVEHALGVRKGRHAALAFVKEFIEQAKTSGAVRAAIERAGLRGVDVAPAAVR